LVVAGHKNKDLDDNAARVIAEARQYLDDVDDLLAKNSTARDFFNAMLQRYPHRRLGATTLWAGTSTLYAFPDRPTARFLRCRASRHRAWSRKKRATKSK
jgi:hypothetical protein